MIPREGTGIVVASWREDVLVEGRTVNDRGLRDLPGELVFFFILAVDGSVR